MIVLTPGTPRTLALARRMVARGFSVCLVEADVHDAKRMRDLLARAGLAVPVGTRRLAGEVQVLDIGAADLPPAPLVVHLAGGTPGAGRAVVDLSSPDLAEVLDGSDPAALELLGTLGIPALTVPAFLAPPLLARIEDAVEALIFDGSTPWEVDAAAESAGFAPGPCAAMDERALTRRTRALPLVNRMVDEGRHGRAAGVGWYRYPGGGGRVIDPLIEDMAREEAHFAGHRTRPVTEAEIRARLLAALGNPPALLARALGLPEEAPCP